MDEIVTAVHLCKRRLKEIPIFNRNFLLRKLRFYSKIFCNVPNVNEMSTDLHPELKLLTTQTKNFLSSKVLAKRLINFRFLMKVDFFNQKRAGTDRKNFRNAAKFEFFFISG